MIIIVLRMNDQKWKLDGTLVMLTLTTYTFCAWVRFELTCQKLCIFNSQYYANSIRSWIFNNSLNKDSCTLIYKNTRILHISNAKKSSEWIQFGEDSIKLNTDMSRKFVKSKIHAKYQVKSKHHSLLELTPISCTIWISIRTHFQSQIRKWMIINV